MRKNRQGKQLVALENGFAMPGKIFSTKIGLLETGVKAAGIRRLKVS